MKPTENYGLWVILMHRCMFINGNKCTTLENDAGRGGSNACVGAANTENLYLFNFAVNLKLLRKLNSFKNPRNSHMDVYFHSLRQMLSVQLLDYISVYLTLLNKQTNKKNY